MGNVENITYDRFPKQKNLGHLVNIGQGRLVPAIVVRWDDEPPHRAIFRTADNEYFEFSELQNLQLPEQGNYLGKCAEVCFHYNERTIRGIIVRDDMAEPFKELIELEDGRIISSTECQYCPIRNEIGSVYEKQEILALRDADLVKKQLKRRNFSERIKLLNGIYHQLVPSRKGKLGSGEFNRKYSFYQKGHRHFVQVPGGEASCESVVDQIVAHVGTQEFVRFLAGEMRKYGQLEGHSHRLEDFYFGDIQLDIQDREFIEIKRV